MALKVNNNTLEKIRNEFNKVLDEHIEKNDFNELIEKIPSMGLGKIVSIYESISEKLLDDESSKQIVKSYIKTIKENKDLKNVYSFYNFIIKNNINSNYEDCLNEALTCVNNIDIVNYNKGKDILSKIVCEAINNVGLSKKNIDNILDESNKVYEDIDYLVLNKKTLKNINEQVKHKNNIINYLKENQISEKNNANFENASNKELMDDLNRELNNINEGWLKELFEEITIANLSSNDLNQLFENYKKECINLIDKIVESNTDITNKSKMLNMKEGLEKKIYTEESFYTDIINLAELKTTLNESIYEN